MLSYLKYRISFLIVSLTASLLVASCASIPRTSLTAMPAEDRIVHPDDTLFQEVLARSLQPNGAVSYAMLAQDTEFTEYLRQIALARPEIFPSRSQQLAFWLNAHNAYALDMIRASGARRSIDDIGGFRGTKVAWIAGELHSLYEIEHSILSRNFREPRAFFALFDGTRSSPAMNPQPYEERTLSDALDAQVRNFLADSTKNRLDKKANTLYLSHIFKEYYEDLERPAGSLVAFVRAFAPPDMASWIDSHAQVKLSYLTADETIFTNDVPHEQPARPQQRKPQPTKRSSGGIE